ncbi:acyl-CoA reductase-like NAD-dependent aldehyde dehydrogenase [Microcella alkaliphila]|uniref:Acyl-CoA reductase-like NAD-dependent aldehyde dehydrogenase n=2 Tax=Microcella TaxID=337004 RepID=A0A4Q7LU02_9MICO|nr:MULTISPECIES: aldehyde dehydrogenase family protein [Microcella]RZS57309.1 acyl-CoA reductase-like NAD-dependent aldehyde dehydrogenase [Microcella putealis]RZT57394.1 acyl-CoA reductase-like NAD-dependent aldehyde dehydrogenase [Microcella alkaliphila]TQM19548.1 acyl-CoA reductase-like NAD-dependent aldehyde dehydrogenase [Microcella putealis]
MTSTPRPVNPGTHRDPWGPFIDGAWTPTESLELFDVSEPALGTRLARVAAADEAAVDAAVRSARLAYENVWSVMPPRERGALMREVAAVIRRNADELAELEAREVGKPRRDAGRFDISFSHASFDYFAGLADSIHGEILDQGPIEARILYEPYGVVAAILPFNWPPIHFAKKSAPALAAGNTVVIKPGEQAPLTVMRLVELANTVLPPGVINGVTGISAGAALAGHPLVERITFTGATATGRKVLQSAAQNLTFATMELGGKNALYVRSDADLAQAVDVAIEGMFYNQGEACTSTARILVHESVFDEFAESFTAAALALKVGDPLEPTTDIGPMVDERQQQRVLAYLDTALAEGATIRGQGAIPSDPHLAAGFWVAPTVLEGVEPGHTVGQEEIFGPIALLMRVRDDDHAVEVANGTEYGLTAAICSRDEATAWQLARRLNAGMVFVNNYMRRAFLGSPFGGVKGSGFGRENAAETIREFVRAKNVRFRSGRGVVPVWPPVD